MGERTKAIERDARIGLDTGMPARVKEIKEWLAINRGQWEYGGHGVGTSVAFTL